MLILTNSCLILTCFVEVGAIAFFICIITTRTCWKWRYLLNFFQGFWCTKIFHQMKGGTVNDQKETRKSSNFDYHFIILEQLPRIYKTRRPDYDRNHYMVIPCFEIYYSQIALSKKLGNANFLHVHLFIIYHLFIYLCKRFII